MQGSPVVEARDITFSYGSLQVLNGLSLSVREGEVFGLLGANGAGKTTLMRMMVGLLSNDGGTLTVQGESPSPRQAAGVGYMPQLTALYQELSIRENVDFFARMYGMSDRHSRGQAVEEAIDLVDLAPRTSDTILNLSGGMRQRVSLAIALVHRPALLLLDEPTVGLDPDVRAVFWERFRRMAESGTTIMVSSHTMDDAAHCDRLAFLRDGAIIALDTPSALREATGTARRLLGGGVHTLPQPGRRLMSVDRTLAITERIIRQMLRDRRSIGLLILGPLIVMSLVGFSLVEEGDVLDRVAPGLLAVFVLFFTFILTGVGFLRERAQGTLERLQTTLVGSFDIMLGYMLGFLLFAVVQAAVILAFTIFVLRIEYVGSLWEIGAILFLVVTVAVSMGIFISSFANNEFQVVQFIPIVLAPQIFLSGVIIPVEQMPTLFEWFSVVLPLTYAVDALREIMLRGTGLAELWPNLVALGVFSLALLTAAVGTLRR